MSPGEELMSSLRTIDPGERTRRAALSLEVSRERLAELCRRHHVKRLSFFGSILRDDFRAGGSDPSDVDVLAEFLPGHTPGWEIVEIEQELSRLFGGRRVDLVNPRYLNRRLKDRILATAQLAYESPVADG